jgi:hypothetical protein
MIDLVELYDLMQLINENLITDDDIRFKEYVVLNYDTELLKFLSGDDYPGYTRQMKRDMTFNEYVDIFKVCDYSSYTQYEERYFYLEIYYIIL